MIDPAGNGQNQFRQAPQGAPQAPPMQGASVAAHPQTGGLTAVPINLQHTFMLRHTSPFDDQVYEGQFTTKKMTIRELAQINVRKTHLNGGFHFAENKPGMGIDEETDNMNNMLAHLEIALLQWPLWYHLDTLYDPTVIMAIYKEVVGFENSFFRGKRKSDGAGRLNTNDSNGTSSESGTVGHTAQVGGGEVQPSLDP